LLSRYLPGGRHFAAGAHTPADARAVLEHLGALLQAIRSYLPRYLVAQLAADPIPGKISGGFFQATIMFADISGFTAMSEKLSALGERGAEEITHHVNAYFTTMLNITGQLGGDLLKFGGDALLVAFFGPQHASRACRAALQMQAAMHRYSQVRTDVGEFSLRMTIGLGTGPLFVASLGSEAGMEYTVMGPGLARMAHAEDQAEAGEIFIDGDTLQAVGASAHTAEVRDGCHRLLALADEALPQKADWESLWPAPAAAPLPSQELDALQTQISHTLEQIRALEPFLPPDLMTRIQHDPVLAASRGEGEFRPVTVLFANFYGVEAIIEALGPERAAEITAILNTHFTAMHQIITRYGGMINKVDSYVVGHRIMALFGAPRAHIDDPLRAVRAALEMQEAMASFAQLETSRGVLSLKQRIGINTGRVFAGNVGPNFRREYSVMGDEVNLTARLMSVSKEGQVLISQSTARQIGDTFQIHELPAVRVKGKSRPVPNFEVLGMRRVQQQERRERQPLIGRDEEWARIQTTADKALLGQTRLLLLSGEAGLGKSRLVQELTAYWTEHHATACVATCPSYGRHTPYLPWIDLLREVFGLTADDSDLERQEKIESRMRAVNPAWADWTALLGHLLGVPMKESEFLRSLDSKLRQQGLFRIVLGLIRAEAEIAPLLIVIDDLQWADEASTQLLDHISQRLLQVPLLVCSAYRPEAENWLPGGTATRAQAIVLSELSEAASLTLLETLLPTTPRMPDYIKMLIVQKAHGNPLFLEEVAYALIENYLELDAESGTYRARSDLARIEIPDTVSRVILSRLDRLDEPSRNVLRVASVIGREFEAWLLSAVYPYYSNRDELRQQLGQLTERELLEELRPEAAYLFRHVLTREVAYESLLYADRRELHRRIASNIESQWAGQLEEYHEVLAHHYQQAEDWPKTAEYYLQAGEKAQAIYANQDALHHYGMVLGAAARLPDSDALKVGAYERMGDVQQITGQYHEALESYAQARAILLPQLETTTQNQQRFADLCRKTGYIYEEYLGEYNTALEWVERGLRVLLAQECIETARLYLVGAAVFQREGHFQEAVRWCHLGIEIAGRLDSTEAQKAAAHAYYLLGTNHRRLGEMEQAGDFYRRSLQTYRALEDSPGMARAHNNLANFHFELDDWASATDHYQKALSILERTGELHGQAVIANNLGEVLLHRGQLDAARNWYQRSLEISKELGLGFGVALLHNNLGHTCIRGQDWEQALAHLQQSTDMFHKIGAQEMLPELYRHLAEAHLGRRDSQEALVWAQRSLEQASAAEMKFEEGLTRRVVGCIARALDRLDEAEDQLRQSLSILKELDSHYEVARTAVHLASLLAEKGHGAPAAQLRRQAVAVFEQLGAELDLAGAQVDLPDA